MDKEENLNKTHRKAPENVGSAKKRAKFSDLRSIAVESDSAGWCF